MKMSKKCNHLKCKYSKRCLKKTLKNKTKRTYKKKNKHTKGGFLGQIINQAVVPLSILGMQQKYNRKTRKHRK